MPNNLDKFRRYWKEGPTNLKPMTVMFYLVVHGIIVAIWYASFLWTPWATFVLSSVALTLTGYAILFDRSWIEQIEPAEIVFHLFE